MTAQKHVNVQKSIHANAVVIGEKGLLIRGASGVGKSSLTYQLIKGSQQRGLFSRLVGDDRVHLSVYGDKLCAKPHHVLSGQIELRGVGIISIPFIASCIITHMIDLTTNQPSRLPEPHESMIDLMGVSLAYTKLMANKDAYDVIEAFLTRQP